LKTDIFQQAYSIVFRKTRNASWDGLVLTCGDGITYRHYIDIDIESLDGKAAWCYCGTRAFPANFPCPKCLVPRDQLHDLLESSTMRTTECMRRVFEEAQTKGTKAEKEKLLRDFGIHDVKVRTHLLFELTRSAC
jgi:hypothetical protein